MNRVMIRTKSQELEIPFGNVLAGYIAESIVEILSEMEEAWDLLLSNHQSLGMDVYKRKMVHQLSYIYLGETPVKDIIGKVVERISQKMLDKGMEVTSVIKENQIDFSFQMEDMYIPFTIAVQKGSDDLTYRKEQKLRLFMENNKVISYGIYPMEQAISQHLLEILRQLELINEMDHYFIVYKILKETTLEGRRVKDYLQKLCEEHHVQITEKTFTLLESYGNYTYMRKKWKVLKRQEKIKEPEWEEVHGLLVEFLKPIWKSMVEEQIFFGDWMPELRRFLD